MRLTLGIFVSLMSLLMASSVIAMDNNPQTHQHTQGQNQKLTEQEARVVVINALDDCVSACQNCIGPCNDHQNTNHISCVLTCMDCSDVCNIMSKLTSRGSALASQMSSVCHTACQACASACEQNTDDKNCMICAESCQKCLTVCKQHGSSLQPLMATEMDPKN
jgi:hypothetical protein